MQLQARGITKFFGDYPVLLGLDCRLSPGRCTVITGPNGSGKSTLLRLLCGLLKPNEGEIAVLDRGGKRLGAPREMRSSFGLVSPEMQLYGELTALENLTFFNSVRGGEEEHSSCWHLLRELELEEWAHREVAAFSTGMKQKLRLAFALSHRPAFLLLDEPTSNLDGQGKKVVEKFITYQKQQGLVVALATNDAEEAESFGDELVPLDQNRTGAAG